MSRSPNVLRVLFLLSILIGTVISMTSCGVTDQFQAPGQDTSVSAPAAPEATVEHHDDVLTSTVVRVIDGDTIAVTPTQQLPATNDAGDEHVVRLLGIDAPEMDWDTGQHECGAQDATAALESLIVAGDTVQIIYDPAADTTDRYGRSLAYVATQTHDDVANKLASTGRVSAWYPSSAPKPSHYDAYRKLQETAQDSNIGSWAVCDTMGR